MLESAQAPVRSGAIGRMLPVYGLTEGLGADRLRQLVEVVLPLLRDWPDPLPESIRRSQGLIGRADALTQIHAPANQEQLQASRRRLVFDEFLLLQLSLAQRRHQLRQRQADAGGLLDSTPRHSDNREPLE